MLGLKNTLPKTQSGFSLVELLVTIVIIGILAAAGIFAYQAYISTSRDAVTSNRLDTIDRTITQDLLSIKNNLNARSALATTGAGADIAPSSICEEYRDAIIREMNTPTGANDKEQNNPFTGLDVACDGNAVSHYADNTSLVQPWNEQFTVERGTTIVYCQNPGETITSPGFGLLTCACTGPEPCKTEPRPKTEGALIFRIAGSNITMDNATAQASGTTIEAVTINSGDLIASAQAAMSSRLDQSVGSISGKMIFHVNDNTTKQQEFKFGEIDKPTSTTYRFLPEGTNKLSFGDVTDADNAVIYLNAGGSVCWTPAARVSPGGPTVTEKTNTLCLSKHPVDGVPINIDPSDNGTWP